MKLKQGTKISCIIEDGRQRIKASIAIYNNDMYLCQNQMDGVQIPIKFKNPYLFSWKVDCSWESEETIIKEYSIKILTENKTKNNNNGRIINLGKEFNFKQ